MPAAAYVLIGAGLVIVTALALGRTLLRGLGFELGRLEEAALAFVAGSALLSFFVFLLAIIGLAHKGVFLGVAGASLLVARRFPAPPSLTLQPRVPAWFWMVAAAVFGVYTWLYFWNAMAPEMSPDGATYHLGLVARYYREHRLVPVPDNMYAHLSQGIEMLYLFAWPFGRNSSAALVHYTYLIATVILMLAWALRRGWGAAAVAGALLYYVSPVVGIDSTSAYNDAAVAGVYVALFVVLDRWADDRNPRWFVPIGILAGFAYGLKYTAVTALFYACAYIAWTLRRDLGRAARGTLVTLACAAVMMLPWIVRNAAWYGNPFSPFFNRWFQNPYIHVSFEEEYRAYLRHFGDVESLTAVPIEATVRGGKLGGLVGPVYLLAPLALLGLRTQSGRALVIAAVFAGTTYFANIGTRFLIPALPFVSIAMMLPLSRSPVLLAVVIAGHAAASWPRIIKKYAEPTAWRLDRIPVKAALRLEPEDHYLRRFGNYNVARIVEELVPEGAVVFAPSQVAEAYTRRRIVTGYQSAEAQSLTDIFWSAVSAGHQPTNFLDFRFLPRTLRVLRAVETAHGGDVWSVSEFRVYSGGRELVRSPAWRLRARPWPWGVQAAFDNTPVTRWRSWRSIEPDMFVEIDFGRDETVDMARLESTPDQGQVRVRIEGVDASRTVFPLSAEPHSYDVAVSLGMRRAAAEELKARGISFIVISDSDYGYDDLYNYQEAWGVALVGERGPGRLYRID